MTNILCDIGGSKTRVAAQTGTDTFSEPVVFRTPNTPEKTFQAIAEHAHALSDEPVDVIAGGVAAIVDPHGSVINSAHLTNWRGVDLKDLAQNYLETEAHFANDAAVVGLGEAHYGAARDHTISAYLTVSTGLGGARIVSGEIDTYTEGSEPGHQIVDHHSGDTLEELVSGSGFEKRFGVEPTQIEDEHTWEEAARILAVGVTNTILHWSPEVVVLGGPMIVGDPAIPLDRVREHISRLLTIFPEAPPIKAAELDDFGGLYGALALLHS